MASSRSVLNIFLILLLTDRESSSVSRDDKPLGILIAILGIPPATEKPVSDY